MSDLIERQAAIDAIKAASKEIQHWLWEAEGCEGYCAMVADVETCLDDLPSAQPYSEAEIQKMQELEQAEIQRAYELGKLDAESRWIPCSERLPNDNDYNSCMECLDGAVWYFTKKGAMGLGYYYKSTKQWATTNDLKIDGKVVAWMPLPEPYREEGTE